MGRQLTLANFRLLVIQEQCENQVPLADFPLLAR